jgi:hypothetical protein
MTKEAEAELLNENAALRAALQHEREVAAAERRRANLFEESARRAYRMAATVTRPKVDSGSEGGV